MLVHRRRWANIKTTIAQRLVFADIIVSETPALQRAILIIWSLPFWKAQEQASSKGWKMYIYTLDAGLFLLLLVGAVEDILGQILPKLQNLAQL